MRRRLTEFLKCRSSAVRVRGGDPPHSAGLRGRALPGAIKAEVVFAVLVIVRHRTTRLALVFAVALGVVVAWQDLAGGVGGSHHRTAWMLIMVLASVMCSRTMALGGSREAGRLVGARWWLVPFGRLIGAVALLTPVVGALGMLLVFGRTGGPGTVAFAVAGLILGSTTGAATMALTVCIGASGAASVCFLGALVGGIDPVSLGALLGEGWFSNLIPRIWTTLPLQWRVEGWPRGAADFVMISAVWLVATLRIAGAAVAGPGGRLHVED